MYIFDQHDPIVLLQKQEHEDWRPLASFVTGNGGLHLDQLETLNTSSHYHNRRLHKVNSRHLHNMMNRRQNITKGEQKTLHNMVNRRHYTKWWTEDKTLHNVNRRQDITQNGEQKTRNYTKWWTEGKSTWRTEDITQGERKKRHYTRWTEDETKMNRMLLHVLHGFFFNNKT